MGQSVPAIGSRTSGRPTLLWSSETTDSRTSPVLPASIPKSVEFAVAMRDSKISSRVLLKCGRGNQSKLENGRRKQRGKEFSNTASRVFGAPSRPRSIALRLLFFTLHHDCRKRYRWKVI